jgi:phosphopantothenoylcysteine decarboxylase / phosphopantothenate---cysteine ligase
MKKTIVLGVTSGIAAYKTLDLIKELKKENIDILVVMTESASKMLDPKEFEIASGNKVYAELFEKDFEYKNILKERKVDHIDVADRADVICIAPATANSIAKIAHGIADDFLTTMLLASNSPVILAPSMNVHMWSNPVTKENITKLKKLGFIILEPERGMLACGYVGPGRLPHILIIKDEVLRQISYSKSLAGKKIIVTAGGTIEPIDAARFLTNKSSGKMGIAIAEECYLRGADITLLRAKNSIEPRYLMRQQEFETADELLRLLEKFVKDSDVLFHAAAVSDFKPTIRKEKLSSKESVTLHLAPQKKIITQIKKLNPKIKLIGFKAVASSSEEVLIAKGREMLKEGSADAIIVNDISKKDRGFQADTNEVFVVTPKNLNKISLRSKKEVARELLNYLSVSLKQNA